MPPSFPSSTFTQRKYALVIDAGSSGSRMQIYSWKDPKAERAEFDQQQQQLGGASGSSSSSKGKARETESDHLARLRRLPRVERGVKEGTGEWQKKVEPGQSMGSSCPFSFSRGRQREEERPTVSSASLRRRDLGLLDTNDACMLAC